MKSLIRLSVLAFILIVCCRKAQAQKAGECVYRCSALGFEWRECYFPDTLRQYNLDGEHVKDTIRLRLRPVPDFFYISIPTDSLIDFDSVRVYSIDENKEYLTDECDLIFRLRSSFYKDKYVLCDEALKILHNNFRSEDLFYYPGIALNDPVTGKQLWYEKYYQSLSFSSPYFIFK